MQNIALVVAASLFAINPPGITPEIRPEDPFDTTSFQTAHVLDHSSSTGLQFFEDYGITDTYDYLKYTAPYSRSVLLSLEVPSGIIAYINVYVESKSMTTPFLTYDTTTELDANHCVFVQQGDTVYFEISCSGQCVWESILVTRPGMSGASLTTYEKMYGYPMPHSGSATIYYAFDSSCNQYMSGHNFTYAQVLEDAISLWESCGNVDFVYDASQATFIIEITDEIENLKVAFEKNLLTNNYYCSEFKMQKNHELYEQIAPTFTNWDGSQMTAKDTLMGYSVIGIGLTLGLVLNGMDSYSSNMMRPPFLPYDHLGDGDIASFITLWGDANGSVY